MLQCSDIFSQITDAIKKICPHWDILAPVMSDRVASRPLHASSNEGDDYTITGNFVNSLSQNQMLQLGPRTGKDRVGADEVPQSKEIFTLHPNFLLKATLLTFVKEPLNPAGAVWNWQANIQISLFRTIAKDREAGLGGFHS